MSFQLINRRVHLYLGMFLLPWVLMYALSSLVFSHLQAISAWDGRGRTIFEIEWEKDLDLLYLKTLISVSLVLRF